MQNTLFTLKNKRNLTCDVFLLEFETKENHDFVAGQFITFLLPKTGFRRAYSVLQKQKNIWRFIVKRLENGRGGSIELCDLELGSEIPGVGPVGYFVLSEKNNNKLFIATGTGMVPIYAMIEKLSLDSYSQKIGLLYGNRSQSENYFTQEFGDLGKNIPNFEFLSCLSGENIIGFTHGRVTTLLTLEMIQKYDEFYICGSPAMVDDVKNILEQNNVKKEKIFFEKY